MTMKFVLARVLDGEFLRIAGEEDVKLSALVGEVAQATGYSERQIYNFREGRSDLPSALIPFFCERFKSRALIDALSDSDFNVEVPEMYDLTRLTSRAVRDILQHYERYLDAFESDGIDRAELAELEISGDAVVRTVRQFLAIAEADCERRHGRKESLNEEEK
jgi:hypothetical protein